MCNSKHFCCWCRSSSSFHLSKPIAECVRVHVSLTAMIMIAQQPIWLIMIAVAVVQSRRQTKNDERTETAGPWCGGREGKLIFSLHLTYHWRKKSP